jgi:hypothetical protein
MSSLREVGLGTNPGNVLNSDFSDNTAASPVHSTQIGPDFLRIYSELSAASAGLHSFRNWYPNRNVTGQSWRNDATGWSYDE